MKRWLMLMAHLKLDEKRRKNLIKVQLELIAMVVNKRCCHLLRHEQFSLSVSLRLWFHMIRIFIPNEAELHFSFAAWHKMRSIKTKT